MELLVARIQEDLVPAQHPEANDLRMARNRCLPKDDSADWEGSQLQKAVPVGLRAASSTLTKVSFLPTQAFLCSGPLGLILV